MLLDHATEDGANEEPRLAGSAAILVVGAD